MTEDIDLVSAIWQSGLFSIAVYAAVAVVRSLVELPLPQVTGSKYWRGLALPTLPLLIGAVVAVACYDYPYPAGIDSASSRALFGLVCGFMSGWTYRILKTIIAARWPAAKDPP